MEIKVLETSYRACGAQGAVTQQRSGRGRDLENEAGVVGLGVVLTLGAGLTPRSSSSEVDTFDSIKTRMTPALAAHRGRGRNRAAGRGGQGSGHGTNAQVVAEKAG